MNCAAATYDTADRAKAVRRSIGRHWNIPISVYQCEACDKYHPRGSIAKMRLPKRAEQVLNQVALGFTEQEIAKNLLIGIMTVRYYRKLLTRAFGAGSLAHLVFICTGLGFLDPNDSVSALVEKCDFAASRT